MKSLILVLTMVALVASGCGSSNANQDTSVVKEVAPLEVRVTAAESRVVERTISVTGSLQADETVTVSNEVAGLLAAIHVDFGQPVRKGQVIAELDKRELQLGLDRSRAALAQILARVGLTPEQADATPETTPTIRQAQAQLDNARTKFESASKLVKTGDIANDRFVEIEKAYAAAQAALDAAHHELRMVMASVQSLKAEVAMAEKRIGDATIRAPIDGSVQERLATPGEYLRQNAPIVKIVKTHPLRLRADIPETAAAAAQVGTKLTFRTDAIPGETFEATVREINPALNPASRTLAVEGRLTQRDGRLRPGMFVQVEMVVQKDTEIVVVPRGAIHTVAGLNKLFLVENGKALERKVMLGKEYDGWIEVRDADFDAGASVALDRLPELTDGVEVRATRTES